MGKKRITKINGKILTQGGNPGDLRSDELDVNVDTDGKIIISDSKGTIQTSDPDAIQGITFTKPIVGQTMWLNFTKNTIQKNRRLMCGGVGNPLDTYILKFDGSVTVKRVPKNQNVLTGESVSVPKFMDLEFYMYPYLPIDWDSAKLVIKKGDEVVTVLEPKSYYEIPAQTLSLRLPSGGSANKTITVYGFIVNNLSSSGDYSVSKAFNKVSPKSIGFVISSLSSLSDTYYTELFANYRLSVEDKNGLKIDAGSIDLFVGDY